MTVSKEFLMGSAVVLLLGAWRAWVKRGAPVTEWLAEGLIPVLLGALGVAYYATLLLNTRWVWSACRLAPTLGLFHDYPLYSPVESGPINGWLYGPVAAILWSPAALADSPLPALAIAAAINLVGLLLPLLMAALLAAPGRRTTGLLAFVAGAAALLQIYPTWYMASALNVDAIAVGLGAGSCLLLVRGPVGAQLGVAALLSALAAWTKQIEAPLVLAQLAWLWFTAGRRTALGFLLRYAVAALAVAALTFSLWGTPAVIFNMWTVPAAQALPGGWRAAWNEISDLIRYTALFWLPCLAAGLWQIRSRAKESRIENSVPFPGLLVVAALVLLPTGVMAAIKVGGDRNSLHSVYYLAVAATVVLGSGRFAPGGLPLWVRPGAVLLAAAILALLTFRQVAGYPALTMLPPRCLSQDAWSYAREHPGRAYFPWDPLATLMAEGKAYHFEYGVLDRIEAGRRPSPAHLTAGLPGKPEVVIYPKANYPRTMLQALPGYRLAGTTDDWLFYRANLPSP